MVEEVLSQVITLYQVGLHIFRGSGIFICVWSASALALAVSFIITYLSDRSVRCHSVVYSRIEKFRITPFTFLQKNARNYLQKCIRNKESQPLVRKWLTFHLSNPRMTITLSKSVQVNSCLLTCIWLYSKFLNMTTFRNFISVDLKIIIYFEMSDNRSH